MDAIKLLFTSDIGLLSVFTVAFSAFFVVFIYGYAKKKMEEDAKNAQKQ
ncbi:MAG: DUF3149 domain-containing protein [Rhodocyclaceae bacterium]|jgi:hypothetical protein|nr:DUF3149 domain-containing protein [Rhodocyclaceae bacterium]MDZ4214668.1 DUF3149 domain-containing protein [Rhodocyclaceae bacterium]